MELTIEIPTYKVGQDEIVLRITGAQYKDIAAGLASVAQRRKASRNYIQRNEGKQINQGKPVYKLSAPIDATQTVQQQ